MFGKNDFLYLFQTGTTRIAYHIWALNRTISATPRNLLGNKQTGHGLILSQSKNIGFPEKLSIFAVVVFCRAFFHSRKFTTLLVLSWSKKVLGVDLFSINPVKLLPIVFLFCRRASVCKRLALKCVFCVFWGVFKFSDLFVLVLFYTCNAGFGTNIKCDFGIVGSVASHLYKHSSVQKLTLSFFICCFHSLIVFRMCK